MLTRQALREELIRCERVWLLAATGSIALILIVFFVGMAVNQIKLDAIKTEIKMLGFDPVEFREEPIVYIKNVVGGLVTSYTSPILEPQKIILDFKFPQWSKLSDDRKLSLKNGRIDSELLQSVKGKISSSQDGTRKFSVRLKGDLLDHISTDVWSLKSKLGKKQKAFNGMREFSIQHPGTRNFYTEALVYNTLALDGILAPRYDFYEMTINGEDKGLIALIEGFSKELIEHRRRKEGVVFRFDESNFWSLKGSQSEQVARDINAVRLKAFNPNKINKRETLAISKDLAFANFQGFLNSNLSANQVFDVAIMGRFFAWMDAFGAEHGVYWNNMRFYFNPATLRIEPIVYDVDVKHSLSGSRGISNLLIDPTGYSVNERSQMRLAFKILCDKEIFKHYLMALEQIWSLDREKFAGAIESNYRQVILQRRYFPLIGDTLDLEDVSENAGKILKKWDTLAKLKNCPNRKLCDFRFDYEKFVRDVSSDFSIMKPSADSNNVADSNGLDVYMIGNDMVIRNLYTQPVEITSICVLGQECITFDDISIDGSSYGELSETHLEVATISNVPTQAAIKFAIDGQVFTTNKFIESYPLARRKHVFQDIKSISYSKDELKNLGAIVSKGVIRFPTGTYNFTKGLFVGPEIELVFDAGSKITMEEESFIFCLGSLRANGSEHHRIRIESVDNKWRGIVAIGDGIVEISHADITLGKGFQFKGVSYTGALNFVRSKVTIDNSIISDSQTEDAVNIVESKNFNLSSVTIRNSLSDALDIDFSDGLIANLKVLNAGLNGDGDGVDFSGSLVRIDGLLVDGAGDKGVSVGEASVIDLSSAKISNVNIGLAGKDGSSVSVSDSVVNSYRTGGVMVYNKKSEYGAANVVVRDTALRGLNASMVATGNSLIIDGKPQSERDFDSSVLYQ